jgi:hypothetical protein
MEHRRNGKVARLPKDIRDELNAMLRDGAAYSKIIAWLNGKGFSGFVEQNITNWFQGGFKEWEAEQERLLDMQAKREFAFDIVRGNQGSQVHEAAMSLAASQLYEAFADFNIADLKALLQLDPSNYTKLVDSLARLSKGQLDIDKYKEQVAIRKQAIQAELNKVKAGGNAITAETIENIETQLKLL